MSNHHEIFEEKVPTPEDELRLQLFNHSFIQIMKTRDGRRFAWGILAQSGFTGQPFTGQRETTDFNCGNRNMGIWLFALIDQFCPDTFSLMMREAKEDLAYDHGSNTTSSSGSGSNAAVATATDTTVPVFGYPAKPAS